MSAVNSQSLQDDVALAAGGDRQAFARVVTATSNLVASVTLVETRDLETARDAAQETYLHAWRDLPKLRNPGSFLPWLRELARRRGREARDRAHRLVTGATADEALASVVDTSPDATAHLLRAEERRALATALDALPDEARETVVLYYREGRSAAQVAGLLGLTEDAVWQRLTRARSQLREDMLARGGELFSRTAPGAGFTAAVLATLGTTAPTAAGAATAAGMGLKWAGGGAGLSALVIGGAGVGGLLAMGRETRWLLEGAQGEAERAAIRRYAACSRAGLIIFALVVPVLAFLFRVRWLYALSFGLYALSLTAVQRVLLPPTAVARLETERGGRLALLGGQWLGLLGGLACLALAAWLYLNPTAGGLFRP